MQDRFPSRLRGMNYDERGNRWHVDPKRHLLHAAGSTPALDSEAVDFWARNGIETVRVHLRDGRVLSCDLATFIVEAKTYDFGHGVQLAARNVWKTADPSDLFENAETQSWAD